MKDEQENIVKLQQLETPLQLQLEKNEVDVGPIKYIAAMIFGDNPNKNLLERAVRYMIILLVAVFDPLAVAMLLASDLHKTPIENPIDIPLKKKKKNFVNKIADKYTDDLIYKLSNEIITVDELSESEQNAVLKKLSKQNNENRES